MGDITSSTNFDFYITILYAVVAVLGFVVAFAGYKLLRLEIILYALSVGFSFGHDYLGLFLGDLIIPGQAELVRIVLGGLLGLSLAILAGKHYKAVLMIDLSYTVIVLAWYALADGDLTTLITLAVTFALLALMIWKFLRKTVILLTSYSGALLGVSALGLVLSLNEAVLGALVLILPIIIAIFAAKVQFNTTEEDED